MDPKIIAALIGLGGVIGGLVMTAIHRIQDKAYKENVAKKDKIYRQLEEFYRPLLGHINHLKSLSKLLFVDKPENFRLLTYLLNKQKVYKYQDGTEKIYELTSHDIVLMEEMLKYYELIEKLIHEKSSLIDDKVLLEGYVPNPEITDISAKDVEGFGLTALLVRHFHLMKSAYEGELSGNEEKYASYIYPREINSILQKNIDSLSNDLKKLS